MKACPLELHSLGVEGRSEMRPVAIGEDLLAEGWVEENDSGCGYEENRNDNDRLRRNMRKRRKRRSEQ